MVSNEHKPRGWRALLGIAAITSVVVSFTAVTPAKADDDDEDGDRGYWNRGRDEHREEAQETWERHEWAEQRPYDGYGYNAQPRAYYYARPRVYYPPPAYYAPQPYWRGFNINIPIR